MKDLGRLLKKVPDSVSRVEDELRVYEYEEALQALSKIKCVRIIKYIYVINVMNLEKYEISMFKHGCYIPLEFIKITFKTFTTNFVGY